MVAISFFAALFSFMKVLLVILQGIFFGLKIGVRIALSRITVIVSFAATMGTIVYQIYSAVVDNTGFLSSAVDAIESASFSIGAFVNSNEWLQVASYALSLDILVDGLIGTFFWLVCTLGAVLVALFFSVFFALAPILSDMIVSGLRMQILSKWTLK